MKIRNIAILLVIAAAFSACSANGASGAEPYSAAITPTLEVTGDVEQELKLTSYEGYEGVKVQFDQSEELCLPVLDIIKGAAPQGENITVFFSAPDGVMAEIPLDELDEKCYIKLTDELGWQFYSAAHPRQSGIKYMDRIVIAAAAPEREQKCFGIFAGSAPDAKSVRYTYGELFKMDSVEKVVLEGEAKQGEKTTNAYSRRKLIPLSALFELADYNSQDTIAYFADGSQRAGLDLGGYLEWRGNAVDYIEPDGRIRSADIIGIWLEAPKASVTDVAGMALDALEKGRVLVIELDGLGYHNYSALRDEGGFLNDKAFLPARTVMPSVSSVALAAIVTGKTGDENGIAAEKIRELICGDMFAEAAKLGKSAAVIEGAQTLIVMSTEQIMNADANGDGYTDNEVMDAAKSALAEGTELTYVHFHGFDDVAHTAGPYSEQAGEKLAELEEYVRGLCDGFKGKVIVTADHGQHRIDGEGKLGEHGEFRPEDMTVPFWSFEVE